MTLSHRWSRSIFLTLTLFLTTISANAKIQVSIIEPGNDKTAKRPLKANVAEETSQFVVVAKDGDRDVKALVFSAKIQLPSSIEAQTASTTSGSAILKGPILTVSGDDFEQEVNLDLSTGQRIKLHLQRQFDSPTIIYDNCNKSFPELNFDSSVSKIPFPVGVSCFFRPSGTKAISVSFPQSAQINSSTFFDILGKGERWRLFEIPDTENQGGVIGNIFVNFKDNMFKMNVVSINLEQLAAMKLLEELQRENKTLKEALDELKKKHRTLMQNTRDLNQKASTLEQLISMFDVYFALGNSALQFNIEQVDFGPRTLSNSELTLQLFTKSRPLWRSLVAEAGFSTTLPMTDKVDRLDSVSAYGGLGWSMTFGAFTVTPRALGAYRNFSHQTSGFSLISGQFGGGILTNYQLGGKHLLGLNIEVLPAGSKVLKSHMGFSLAYERQFEAFNGLKLGGKFESVSLGAENSVGAPQKFSESRVLFYLSL